MYWTTAAPGYAPASSCRTGAPPPPEPGCSRCSLWRPDRTPTSATALTGLGVTLWTAGRLEEAVDAHCRARALSTDAGDRHGTALAWHNLGLVWMDRKEYERALIAFGRARALFGDVGDWHGAAVACYATGCLEQRIPQPDRTVRALEEAAESWKVILSLVPQPRSKVVLGTWP